MTKISEPEVKDEVTTQTFKQPSVGWVGRCLLAGVSFVVAVSTHTLMSSTMALTYTHPAHICSSHYPLRPLSFLPVTGEFYFKIIKNPLKSRLRNVMISFQAFQADTTGRHWGGTWKVGLKAVLLHQLAHLRARFAYDARYLMCQFVTGASPSSFYEASYVLNDTHQIMYGLIFILFQRSLFFFCQV